MELAGTGVRRTGIYHVTHQAHRPTHQAILQRGDIFPVCRTCAVAVKFEFVQPLTESDEIEHILGDHCKSGQRLSLQNRPKEVAGPGPVCSILPPPVEASRSWCASFAGRI